MAEPKRKPPKLGPPKQKTNESPAPQAARKPPKLPAKQPSQQAQANGSPASPPTARKPPKLPPKQPSQQLPEQQNKGESPAAPTPAQKPPKLPPKQPSQQAKPNDSSAAPSTARKPPKLPPKQPSQYGNGSESSAAQARRPSAAPRQSSAAARPSAPARKPSTASQANSTVSQKKESGDQVAEDQDLKSFLSNDQCADLTFLIASIMVQMRKVIENNFDASAMLNQNLLGDSENKGQNEEDKIMNAKVDPGTVDVGEYDKERKLRAEREKELKKPETQKLKQAALKWFDDWREMVLKRVGEVVSSKKTAIQQKDQAASQKKDSVRPTPSRVQSVQKVNTSAKSGEYSAPKLEELFPRIQTPLTKLPMDKRVLILHSILLLLLSLEHYNAASRVLLLNLASSLKLGLKYLREDEEKTGKGLLEAAKSMSADEERQKKVEQSKQARKWKVGLATAAGAAVIGISGGMAAPMIAAGVGSVMGGLGLGATAAAGYLGSVAGSTTLVGSLFGAYGGRMTGQMMENLSAEVEDFAFLPIHGERKEHDESTKAATDTRRLRVIIAITGWLLEKEEVVTPWRVLKPSAEVFALRFELEALMNLGQSINTMVSSAAWGYAQSAVIQRTVFAQLMSAMWPMALVKVARVVDNPFSLAKTRADKAGEVLAEALINKAQGERPVTLIGYSLGARVIWSCLTTLAKRRAFGLVESVVMIGSPIPSDTTTWRLMRAAVSGRLVNVYSTNDYLLAFLYRTSSLQYGVAGLMPIEGLPSIENVDVSETVSGHLRYRYLVGSILQKIGFEDIDKDEVEKETQAFEAMVEEEKKHSYVEDAKENAGELYDKYGKRIKKGGKKAPEKSISDADADKQASAMEKEVQQKTQKGLMQWAVEQLYISRPSVPSSGDVKDAASNPQDAVAGASKSAKKTTDAATKSLYQRAKEAAYLSRSGGPEGELAEKDKLANAQKTVSSAAPSSYLQTAAGYIPTSYIPGLGASGKATKDAKGPVDDAQKKASKATRDAQKTIGDATKPALKKTASAQKAVGDAAKPVLKKTGSTQKKLGDAAKDPGKAAGDAQKAVGDNAKDPSKAASDTQKKVSNAGVEAQKKAGEAKDSASKATGGVTSYIPSFGLGSSSTKEKPTAPKRTASSAKTDKPKPEAQKPADDVSKTAKDTAGNAKEKTEDTKKGYSSYLPSFGLGGPSKEKPDPKKATESAKDATGKAKDTASKGTEDAEKTANDAKATASKGTEKAKKVADDAKDTASKSLDEPQKVADTASSPESKADNEAEEIAATTKNAISNVASPENKPSPSETVDSTQKTADNAKKAVSEGTGEAKAAGADLLAAAGGPVKFTSKRANAADDKTKDEKPDDAPKGTASPFTQAASSAGNVASAAVSPFTQAASSAGKSASGAASTASSYTPKFSGLGGDAGGKLGEVASGTASGAKSGASFLGKEAGDAAKIAGGAQQSRGEATQAASDKAGEAVDDATKGKDQDESSGYGKAASGLAGVGSRDKMVGGAVSSAGAKASEASGKEEGSGYVEGAKEKADPFIDEATDKGKGYLGSAADGAKSGAGAVGGAASSAGSAAASGAGSVASGVGGLGKGIGKGFGFGG